MSYVKIKVKEIGNTEDLQRWEDHMQEKAKCWNNFCLGCYEADDLQPVYVEKEDVDGITYLTTMCKDCISSRTDYGVLVNDNYLMVEKQK